MSLGNGTEAYKKYGELHFFKTRYCSIGRGLHTASDIILRAVSDDMLMFNVGL